MANKNNKNKSGFTAEEQARIDAEVKAYQEKVRQAEIEAEIRNRTLDQIHSQPGYRYY